MQEEFRAGADTFALVVDVSRTEFERMVRDALDEIPDALAAELENVAVMVDDWPTPEQLARVGARGTLLGLYEGVPLTARWTAQLQRRRARSHHHLPGTVGASCAATSTSSPPRCG